MSPERLDNLRAKLIAQWEAACRNLPKGQLEYNDWCDAAGHAIYAAIELGLVVTISHPQDKETR
jgi:hypothetical protein